MGQEVQGKVTYGSAGPSGSGGGGTVTGARNGVSLDMTNAVVLGSVAGDVTYPAKLLDVRWVPMNTHNVRWIYDEVTDATTYFAINEQGYPLLLQTDPSVSGMNWEQWGLPNQGTTYTPFGRANNFTAGFSLYNGVNEPATSRPNVVGMPWGYNTTYQQGRIDTDEASFRFATETFFVIGSDGFFEFHWPEVTTQSGSIYRNHSMYVDRQNMAGTFFESVVNDWLIFDAGHNPSGGLDYLHIQYNPSADATGLALRSFNSGGVTAISLGNYTDGPAGDIVFQLGEMVVQAPGILDLKGTRVALDASINTNIVSPCVFSNNNTDNPPGDSQMTVDDAPLLGSRPFPRMTTTQRNALAITGGASLWIYNTTTNRPNFWDGAAWQAL